MRCSRYLSARCTAAASIFNSKCYDFYFMWNNFSCLLFCYVSKLYYTEEYTDTYTHTLRTEEWRGLEIEKENMEREADGEKNKDNELG